MVQGKVCIGFFQYELVFGVMVQNLFLIFLVNMFKFYIGIGNLYVLMIYLVDSVNYSGGMYCDEKIIQIVFFVSDMMKFDECWLVLVGVCYINYIDIVYSIVNIISVCFIVNLLSLMVVVMYKLCVDIMVYVSYVEVLEQSVFVLIIIVNVNQIFVLIKSKQVEVGVKIEYDGWNGSLVLFCIECGLQYINSVNVYVVDGQSVYCGVEVNGLLQLMWDLSLDGSVMVMDLEIIYVVVVVNGKCVVGVVDM